MKVWKMVKKTLAFFGGRPPRLRREFGSMRATASGGKGGEGVVGLVGEDVAVGEEQDARAAHGLAGEAPFRVEQFPGDLEGDGGLAGSGGEGEQDAPVAPRDRLQSAAVDGLVLVVARLPFAAGSLELYRAEGVAPRVRLGEGAVPELLRRREGQEHVVLGAGRHVDAVPAQPVRGVGESGAEPAGIVLGLPDAVAMTEAGPLGLQHGELLPLVEQDIVAGQALATLAAGLDAAGADHLAPDARTFDDVPQPAALQRRIDALGAGIGFGLVMQAHGGRLIHVNSPAKARCRRDWRRSSRSDDLMLQYKTLVERVLVIQYVRCVHSQSWPDALSRW